jgi:NTP pyrophosphatase (non-canonical NTP hydrolase)
MEQKTEMEQQAREFLNNYMKFVDGVTSKESKDTEAFIARIRAVDELGGDPARLLTAGYGLSAEGGEFNEIVKKIFFQGKPYNFDNVYHMKRELGDVIWYWMNACIALGMDPVTIIIENIKKLETRYPMGEFNVFHSEVREDGDI